MSKKVVDLEKERRIRANLERLSENLKSNPRLAERTMDALAGTIPGLTMTDDTVHIPVRMPAPMLARLEALEPFVKSLPELSLKSKVSRSDLIRIAILKGIEALEKEQESR